MTSIAWLAAASGAEVDRAPTCEFFFGPTAEYNSPEAREIRAVDALLSGLFPDFESELTGKIDSALGDLIREDLVRLSNEQRNRYLTALRATKLRDRLHKNSLGYFSPDDGFIELPRESLEPKVGRLVFFHERRHLLDSILRPKLFERWTMNPLRTAIVEWRAQRDVYRLVKRAFDRNELKLAMGESLSHQSVLEEFLGLRPTRHIAKDQVIDPAKSPHAYAKIANRLSGEIDYAHILFTAFALGERVGATVDLRKIPRPILSEFLAAPFVMFDRASQKILDLIKRPSKDQGELFD